MRTETLSSHNAAFNVPPAAPDAAYEEERRRIRQLTGRPATLLTSGLGDTSRAPVEQPKVLGA